MTGTTSNAALGPVTREEYDTTQRWGQTAATWLEKATVRLQYVHELSTGDVRWSIGYHAEKLLHACLLNAGRLATLIPDDLVDDALEQVGAVTDVLKRRRLAAKLEQVAGRTGPEADAFRAKATALRGNDA